MYIIKYVTYDFKLSNYEFNNTRVNELVLIQLDASGSGLGCTLTHDPDPDHLHSLKRVRSMDSFMAHQCPKVQ